MTEGDDAKVTPSGVRDGDPDALEAVVARRGPAVLAFCEAACGPETAVRVAAEAFARFRAAVVAAPDASALVPDELLLGATRHAAASFAQVSPGAGGGVRRVLGRTTGPNPCADVPAMLAARAEASLTPADLQRLARHLDRCAGCKWLEAAFAAAEAAFRSPPAGPPPEQAAATILATMRAAAPVGPGAAVPGVDHFSLPAHVPEPALAGAAAPAAAGIRPAGAGPTPVAAPEADGAPHVAAPQGHELPRPTRAEPDLRGIGPFLRWILPGATVLAGVVGAMAVAGVL